ncbi:hypothetical protein [Desulfonema magnum]|uniref:Uncharacterized protein n=1 Tax=Desulfonema magnum TaxID=45655 RepID=A0A975BLJ7_9BACT|nr:hypothetical protein [Desulfonema magnum]QTA87636.1 Uncharacterized protein dnm_036700 [Desulfonema magnum]
MIILDEQLLGRNIETEIAKWYRGAVQFVIELRPRTVIKDEAIPKLLRQQKQPTFVTINEKDFWLKVPANNKYCVVCFTLPDSRSEEISQSLRILFRYPEFSTKSKRMGKVVRITDREISYYTSGMHIITL